MFKRQFRRFALPLLFVTLSVEAGITITDGVTTEECAQVTVIKSGCVSKTTRPIPAHLLNLSTRGHVLTGDSIMIAGFILAGAGPRTVLVLARGPSLRAFGVPNTLSNPVLQLYSGSTLVGINDDWVTNANSAEVVTTGHAPSSEIESALLVTLAPGAYTAFVTGAGGSTGVAIVEIYLQP